MFFFHFVFKHSNGIERIVLEWQLTRALLYKAILDLNGNHKFSARNFCVYKEKPTNTTWTVCMATSWFQLLIAQIELDEFKRLDLLVSFSHWRTSFVSDRRWYRWRDHRLHLLCVDIVRMLSAWHFTCFNCYRQSFSLSLSHSQAKQIIEMLYQNFYESKIHVSATKITILSKTNTFYFLYSPIMPNQNKKKSTTTS